MTLDPARFLQDLRAAADKAGVFAEVSLDQHALRCKAQEAAADAWYSVVRQGGQWWVRLATPDRWLSESIESDLMHDGDPIEELIEEELVELGHDVKREGPMPTVKHFRSEDKLYTFENPIPIGEGSSHEAAVALASRFLLAYEAAFRQLGDMQDDGEGEDS
jgi:hypothetical protein